MNILFNKRERRKNEDLWLLYASFLSSLLFFFVRINEKMLAEDINQVLDHQAQQTFTADGSVSSKMKRKCRSKMFIHPFRTPLEMLV